MLKFVQIVKVKVAKICKRQFPNDMNILTEVNIFLHPINALNKQKSGYILFLRYNILTNVSLTYILCIK